MVVQKLGCTGKWSCESLFEPDKGCDFGVYSPGYRNDIVEQTAFNLFAMDVEEHREKIERFVNLLSYSPDPNEEAIQNAIFDYVGLSPASLTSDEIDYIEKEVARRYVEA